MKVFAEADRLAHYFVDGIGTSTMGRLLAREPCYRSFGVARDANVRKDDPVTLVRVQMKFPATGEVLKCLRCFVAGWMRGSHQMPLMP